MNLEPDNKPKTQSRIKIKVSYVRDAHILHITAHVYILSERKVMGLYACSCSHLSNSTIQAFTLLKHFN
jgi:hypothetical protein